MPEVYTGKVLIPGDQIDAYLAARQAAEEARAPFRALLEGLNGEFGASLDKKYSRKTVRKHTGIVELFIIFLCDYTDVERLEEVTRTIANTARTGKIGDGKVFVIHIEEAIRIRTGESGVDAI